MRTGVVTKRLPKVGSGFLKIMTVASAVVLLAGALALTAEAGPKTIKVGGTLPLSGVAAQDAESILNGRKLAVEKYNEEGGVQGMKFELVMRDDGLRLKSPAHKPPEAYDTREDLPVKLSNTARFQPADQAL